MNHLVNNYKFNEISIGQSEHFHVEITQEMMTTFENLTGDINPLHTDIEYAKSMNYKEKVVYGMLTSSMVSTLAGVYLPGKYSLIHQVEINFINPVYIGDILKIQGTVKTMDERFHTITLKIDIFNQDGKKVTRGKMRIGVL